MFHIGDKIVYPMHGAGTIKAIEEKEVLGEKQLYYVMDLKNMKVMFPTDAKIGVREIVDSEILDAALKVFNQEASEHIQNPTQRQRAHMGKLKSGDIIESVKVIRDLTHLSKQRPLAIGDKTILDNARQIVASELALVKGMVIEEADEYLDEVINS